MAETIWDEAAERAVLGCVLEDDRSLLVARRKLKPEDFASTPHAQIFAAMCSLADERKSVDQLLLCDRLTSRGKLAECGGPAFLMTLDASLPFPERMPEYAGIVADRSARRKLAKIGRYVATVARDLEGASPETVTANAITELLAARTGGPTGPRPLTEYLVEAYARMEAVEAGTAAPIMSTGIAGLDELIGGWQPTLSVVGARTGVGKSAFLATAIQNVARAGNRVGVFSLEDEGEWLAWRFLAYSSGVNQFVLRYRKKNDHDWERVGRSSSLVEPWAPRVLIDDRPSLTAQEMALAIDEMVINHGVEIVFVDHLKEMNHAAQRRERQDLNIEASLQILRAAQKRHSIPLVIAHQMNEADSKAKDDTPSLSDFSDGKVVGKMARVALALTRDEDTMRIHVLKQTNGFARKSVDVTFVNAAAMVESIERPRPAQGKLLPMGPTGSDD